MVQCTNGDKALDKRTPIEQVTGKTTPIERVTGKTPDILEFLDFIFYNHVWVHENAGLGEQIFCRNLGASHRLGDQMTYYVLKANGQIIYSIHLYGGLQM